MGFVIANTIIRMKLDTRRIPVEATFDRVWEQMALLLSQNTLKKFIERNIKNDFFGLKLEPILKTRTENNIKLGTPKSFITIQESEKAAENAVISLNQAYEFFESANKAGLLTKPVFLYYGMVSFAKALISSTYTLNDENQKMKKKLGHGLSVNDDEFKVTIKREGEYQTFRDCYMGDTRLYARKHPLNINLKDLLEVIPGMRIEWQLAYEKNFNKVYRDLHRNITRHKHFGSPSYEPFGVILKTSEENFNIIYGIYDEGEVHNPEYVVDLGIHGYYDGLNISKFLETTRFIHILDAYYLTMFILCFFARYRPYEWNKFLKRESNLFLIKTFLNRAELDFPMLMYSEFTGIKTYFSTFG